MDNFGEKEWCPFNEIRKGDWVEEISTIGDVTQTVSGVAHTLGYEDTAWVTEDGYIIVDKDRSNAIIYHRKPIQEEPDPNKYPVLKNVIRTGYVGGLEFHHDFAVWDGYDFYLLYNDGVYLGGWKPESITRWEEGKVC